MAPLAGELACNACRVYNLKYKIPKGFYFIVTPYRRNVYVSTYLTLKVEAYELLKVKDNSSVS